MLISHKNLSQTLYKSFYSTKLCLPCIWFSICQQFLHASVACTVIYASIRYREHAVKIIGMLTTEISMKAQSAENLKRMEHDRPRSKFGHLRTSDPPLAQQLIRLADGLVLLLYFPRNGDRADGVLRLLEKLQLEEYRALDSFHVVPSQTFVRLEIDARLCTELHYHQRQQACSRHDRIHRPTRIRYYINVHLRSTYPLSVGLHIRYGFCVQLVSNAYLSPATQRQ